MNVQTFAKNLKDRGLLPANIQMATWNEWTLVSCFDNKSSNYISESVSMGVDVNSEIALFKALTEFCERSLTKSSTDPVSKLTSRSDGFAAFPAIGLNDTRSQSQARKNAFAEALERYLWSMWWDNTEVLYKLEDSYNFPSKKTLINEFDLLGISTIEVSAQDSDSILLILVARNKSLGYITGGAAGLTSERTSILNRAFGELLRHLIVLQRMTQVDISSPNLSFYEKRLLGFGSGKWGDIAAARLKIVGSTQISLPELDADAIVKHDHMDLISLHRCLFKDQHPFMGGEIERLCI